jgi:DNA polymerase III delta prime subunit
MLSLEQNQLHRTHMSLDQEMINAQLDLLAVHRRTLAVYLRQQAQLGVLAPPGLANGIAETQSAIRSIKEQLRAEGVLVADEPSDDVQPAAIGASSQLDRQQQRNRQTMLAKVKAIWVAGLLDKSLAKETRIALGLTEQPDAVDISLKKLVQELNHLPHDLPASTPIIDVFTAMGGALLVLGAPGAGKTTLLLELARDLIGRAESDENHPIPVVFNLSSWATERPPLKEWLVEELNQRYDVPKKTAQGWVDTDAILPLLDGLDEVAVEHRSACVEAINVYRQARGFVPLAVCSRMEDYQALTVKLRLQGAALVQPLTQQQIGDYLEQAGERLAGVRATLQADRELAELLVTPLMLSIVVLAYAGKTPAELQPTGMIDERRRHLFDAYIKAMFARRNTETHYSEQQTTLRLSWLARKLVSHSQTIYYLERMQPDWLVRSSRFLFAFRVGLVSALIGGLAFGQIFGQVLAQASGQIRWQVSGLVFGLGFGLVGGLVGGLSSYSAEIHPIEKLRWSWSAAGGGRHSSLLFTLMFGLIIGLIFGLVAGLNQGLVL